MQRETEPNGQERLCVIVPTYNNERTLADVLRRIMRITTDIIVVNDGSTQATADVLAADEFKRLTVVDYGRNRGKGYALRRGMERATAEGYTHAVTIDSDGQHFPEDIPLLMEAHREYPEALIVGARNLNEDNMPRGNTFANKFSNFWVRLQTGRRIDDTQSGLRLYPLRRVKPSWAVTPRYEAELELLVFSAWANIPIHEVPVHVYYPPKDERVSHFRPFADFLRISILNTVLCFLAVVYGWPRRIIHQLVHHGKTL